MEEETKLCPNCKREIPAVNFTIHSVHCARNIRVCPVCKEPVPQHELGDHHEKLHKLQPCQKCGESVCGTDLEDHIRDSCAHTIKSCRFCELELPRREIPAHENYCGVRTEQCADCREWVMIKYRQLHVDSNHGFLRLDDDPVPRKDLPKLTRPLTSTGNLSSTNLPSGSNRPNGIKVDIRPSSSRANSISTEGPKTEMRYFAAGSGEPSNSSANGKLQNNTAGSSKGDKHSGISRGAVKKRPAPKPPVKSPPPLERRDLPYYRALQRQQHEEQHRQELTAHNLAMGLPPVLSPAAKLEKLRKLDALQNPDTTTDYRNKLTGRVWMSPEHTGNILGSERREPVIQQLTPETRQGNVQPKSPETRQDLDDIQPMTPQEFMQRFNELQLRKDSEERKKSADRFSEIKSSLRELRRGLNEVTAPYNNNSNGGISYTNNNGSERRSGRESPQSEVRLPCEFCGELILDIDLVQHQTGCRPDLAQIRPRSESPGAARASPASLRVASDAPVIPCEFCAESLPVYLISEHQERCGREANLLFPD